MNAIYLIAFCALLAIDIRIFMAKIWSVFCLVLIPLIPLKKSMGYQRKASIHAGCTPDTPDTSQKTEVALQTTKNGQQWAPAT